MQRERLHTIDEQASAFQQGDEAALEFFFLEFYSSLCLFSNHFVKNDMVAEEIAAEGFVKTWRMNYKLDTADSIRAYLYTIVRNDSLRYVRKNKASLKLQDNFYFPDESNHVDALINAEVARQLYKLVDQLPPKCSGIMRLHYLEGKTVSQISRELNLSTSTVKTQKARGLSALRKKIKTFFLSL